MKKSSVVRRRFIVVAVFAASMCVAACGEQTDRAEENSAVVSQFIEEFKNKANHSIVYDLFAESFVHHLPDARLPPGRDGMVALGQGVHGAFPDVHVTVEDLIATDDMVVERTTARGTHLGEFQGVAATGRPVVWTETHIYRLTGGKIVEYWPQVDVLAILIQIGAVPAPGGQ